MEHNRSCVELLNEIAQASQPNPDEQKGE
jgi:hypothetical protein